MANCAGCGKKPAGWRAVIPSDVAIAEEHHAVIVAILPSCISFHSNCLKATKLRRKQAADVMKVYWKPMLSAINEPVKLPTALPVPISAVNKPVFPRGITSIESESTEIE